MIDISFLVIAYNEEKTIHRCIDSILKQEGLGNFELIVIDDGSIDDTGKVVKTYTDINLSINLIQLRHNQGRGFARATGIEVARGRYIAFVDADIILPSNWSKTCLQYIESYDAVGGIAIPDGDVNYIYSHFNLKPKKVHQSTTITGSNGLYRHEIFTKLNFEKNLREGEDVAFNHLMQSNVFKIRSIDSLEVIHRESKPFNIAIKWLYQSGIGATRQLRTFKKIRLPDVAFFLCILILIISLIFTFIFGNYYILILIPIYIILVSLSHIYTRFYFSFKKIFNYIGAIFFDVLLLSAYFIGRTIGLIIIN